MLLQLNIGLWVNGKSGNIGPRTVMEEVIAELKPYSQLSRIAIAKSGEPTLVVGAVVADNIDVEAKINRLCMLLSQDCIAGKADEEGFLIGPNTAPYGDTFNPEYFIEIN